MDTERRWADSTGGSATTGSRRLVTEVGPGGSAGVILSEARLHAGSLAGLRSLRSGLGHCLLQGECRPDTIADAQLVLAEIATNAFVYDLAPLVEVRVVCADDEITITTAHRGDVAPPPYPIAPTSLSGPHVMPDGRGLAIVDRIVTSREVESRGGCTTTTVRLPR